MRPFGDLSFRRDACQMSSFQSPRSLVPMPVRRIDGS